MPSFSRRPVEAGIHEPNMTPLIDVSLVLVVILMVATPMAFQSGIAVQSANRSGRRAPEHATTFIEQAESAWDDHRSKLPGDPANLALVLAIADGS